MESDHESVTGHKRVADDQPPSTEAHRPLPMIPKWPQQKQQKQHRHHNRDRYHYHRHYRHRYHEYITYEHLLRRDRRTGDVHSLFASQIHYNTNTACAFIAILFVVYLVHSRLRRDAIQPIQNWIRFGGWIYKKKVRELEKYQSSNSFEGGSQYVAPRTAWGMIECAKRELMYIEELSGIIIDPDTVKAMRFLHDSVDEEFVKAGALISLEKALRRLFFHALDYPVGATMVHFGQVNTIGIRWKPDVPLDRRRSIIEEFRPEVPDYYDQLDVPTLETLEKGIDIQTLFFIDFIDSHLNDEKTGLPSSDEQAGSGVWIEFWRLTDLAYYLYLRYPTQPDDLVSKNIQQSRKNHFDMVIWRATNPDTIPDMSDILQIADDKAFGAWADWADIRRADARTHDAERRKHLGGMEWFGNLS